MSREIGNSQNLERLAVELYYKPKGDAGAINAGNCLMLSQQTPTDAVKGYFHGRSGTSKEVRNDQKDSSLTWKVKCNEHTDELDALLLMGKVGDNFSQAAIGVDVTVEIVSTKRRVFDLGKLKLIGVSAVVGVTAKIKGVRENGEIIPANADYVVDHLLGKIYIPETSTIADGATLAVTFQAAAVTGKKLKEVGMHTKREGSFELVGFAGEETVRKIFKFDGHIKPAEHGDMGIESFNEFSFEVVATGDVAVTLFNE